MNTRTIHANRQYYGLNRLDTKIEPYLDMDNGFFVDVGAYDGQKQSNTYYFEQFRNWQGILIEPSPIAYLKCARLRGQVSQTVCAACVGFDYPDNHVDMTYADIMTVTRGVESDIADLDRHLASARKFMGPDDPTFAFAAPARTLTAILDTAQAPPSMELLSLDTEGSEAQVLAGLDFARYEFKYILVKALDAGKVYRLLRDREYKLAAKLSKHDYLFTICDPDYRAALAEARG